MIDHERKCIFLHIGRTGGTSIDVAFLNEVYFQSLDQKHLRPLDIIEMIGLEKWDEYFKFSFVRNPWDRLVSMYFYRRDVRCVIPSDMSFKGFVRWVHFDCHPFTQVKWFQDRLQEMDFIGRFENLEDYQVIRERFGLDELPHHEATTHDHYTTYYDLETRQFVADYYAEDIKEFGYSFDSVLSGRKLK